MSKTNQNQLTPIQGENIFQKVNIVETAVFDYAQTAMKSDFKQLDMN